MRSNIGLRAESRTGFTLVEVMVALVLGAMVLLGGRALFESLATETTGIARAATDVDHASNAELELRAAVGQIEAGTKWSVPFEGDETHASFTSWCVVPRGWMERCRTTLRVASDPRSSSGSRALVLERVGVTSLIVRSGLRSAALRYLTSPAQGGNWSRTWKAGVSAPLAIGAVVDRDTLILRIGGRG